MNSKFLVKDRPTLTAMLKHSTTEHLLAQIEKILEQGTDVFGFQIDMLKPEERCEKTYRTIFNAMQGKPCYVTNYYRGNPTPQTDDALMDGLFTAVSCADTLDSILVDMPGDTFDRIMDNSKILNATGMKQSELMTLENGLKFEISGLPKNFSLPDNTANIKMDKYLEEHK